MQRVIINQTASGPTLTYNWVSFAADSAANMLVTFIVLCANFPFIPISAMAAHASHRTFVTWHVLPFFLPTFIFAFVTLRSLYFVFFPATMLFNRDRGEITRNGKLLANLDDLETFDVSYTGTRSPSRFALIAGLRDGRKFPIVDSGYFGSRLEMEQLKEYLVQQVEGARMYAV